LYQFTYTNIPGEKDRKAAKIIQKLDEPSQGVVFMQTPIRISSPKLEGILQVSKWIKMQVLLDGSEMEELLNALGSVYFVVVSEPVKSEQGIISKESFLEKYTDYIYLLKRGEMPPPEEFRRFFSCALSSTLAPFYAIAAGNEKFLIKPVKPVIQLQAHHFFYSDLDGKFHPMVLSPESISWGVQISYPQLYQDPTTRQVVKIIDSGDFPNTALFTQLIRWMRSNTLPTPFHCKGARINAPIRIGKQSLAWIKNHPQLKQKGIEVLQLGRE
jgi:hypothetical protein